MNAQTIAVSVRHFPKVKFSYIGKWLGIGLLYFLLAKISYLTVLPGPPSGPTLVWLPTGFAAAALIFEGYIVLPGILLGSLLYAVSSDATYSQLIGWSLAHTIDPLIVAWLPRRILRRDIDFTRPYDVCVFIGVTLLMSSTFSATVGATSGWLSGSSSGEDFISNWCVWWVSDFLSVLILTPMLLAPPIFEPIGPRWNIYESLGVTFAGALLSFFIFFATPFGHNTLHFVYWLLPFIVWLAFRRGHRAMSTGIFLMAVAAIASTSLGKGPFVGKSLVESFMNVESFLAVVSIMGLLMAALVSERNRAIENRDRFLLIASEEMHAPLNALRMISFFLNRLIAKGELDETTRAKRLELVSINSQELARMSHLLEELMETSKVAAGKLTLAPEEMDLNELVTEMVKDFAKENSLGPGLLEFQPGGEIRGKWDKNKLRFIVRSLLSNALKFGERRSMRVETHRTGSRGYFSVEDRGIGISSADQIRIFGRFCRLDPVQSQGGLGQSLFISQTVAQAHGGQIRVESAPRKGSTFSLELPL